MAASGRLGMGYFSFEWSGVHGEHSLGSVLILMGDLKTRQFPPGSAVVVTAELRAQQLVQRSGVLLGTSQPQLIQIGYRPTPYASSQNWDTTEYPNGLRLQFPLDGLAVEELEQCRQGRPFEFRIDGHVLLANPGDPSWNSPDGYMGPTHMQDQQTLRVSELEWAQVLFQWRRGVGIPVVVSLPGPLVGDESATVIRLIDESWRKINSGDYEGSIVCSRKVLESLRLIDGVDKNPGDKKLRSVAERVSHSIGALFDLASSPLHVDGATKNFKPERSDAIGVLGATTSLAHIVFRQIERNSPLPPAPLDRDHSAGT